MVKCPICDGTGILGECIGICKPPNLATHVDMCGVPLCDECDPQKEVEE